MKVLTANRLIDGEAVWYAGDGRYALVAPLPNQQFPRPDVAAALGAPQSMLSGWEAHVDHGATEAAAVIALRCKNRSAALVATLT